MKTKGKIITSMLLFILIAFAGNSVFAQTPTAASKTATSSATTAPLNEDEMKNVKKIIDLVASNSATQKISEKRGVLGKVIAITTSTLTLQVHNGESRIIDIDEITKFSDLNVKSFGISDIKNGDNLGIIGILNKVSKHVLARNVRKVTTIPVYFDGAILSLNKKDFTLDAVDESGNKKLVNIETSTKINSFTKEDGQLKIGFSKLRDGQRMYVAGFIDSKNKNQINADRILFFPDLSISQKMKNYVNLEQQTGTPSAQPSR